MQDDEKDQYDDEGCYLPLGPVLRLHLFPIQSVPHPCVAHSNLYHPLRAGPSISSKVLLMSRFPTT